MVQRLSTADVRRLAAELEVDVRSVWKEIQGQHVRGMSGERIRRALADRGIQSSDSWRGLAA